MNKIKTSYQTPNFVKEISQKYPRLNPRYLLLVISALLLIGAAGGSAEEVKAADLPLSPQAVERMLEIGESFPILETSGNIASLLQNWIFDLQDNGKKLESLDSDKSGGQLANVETILPLTELAIENSSYNLGQEYAEFFVKLGINEPVAEDLFTPVVTSAALNNQLNNLPGIPEQYLDYGIGIINLKPEYEEDFLFSNEPAPSFNDISKFDEFGFIFKGIYFTVPVGHTVIIFENSDGLPSVLTMPAMRISAFGLVQLINVDESKTNTEIRIFNGETLTLGLNNTNPDGNGASFTLTCIATDVVSDLVKHNKAGFDQLVDTIGKTTLGICNPGDMSFAQTAGSKSGQATPDLSGILSEVLRQLTGSFTSRNLNTNNRNSITLSELYNFIAQLLTGNGNVQA